MLAGSVDQCILVFCLVLVRIAALLLGGLRIVLMNIERISKNPEKVLHQLYLFIRFVCVHTLMAML